MNEVPQQEPYPHQGYAYPYAYGPPTTYGHKNGIATAALVTGIVGASLFFIPGVGMLLGILALVFGVVALVKIKRGTSDAKGRAITGVVLGPVAILLGIVMWAAYYQAASDLNDYDNCIDHTRLANWDRCEKYLD